MGARAEKRVERVHRSILSAEQDAANELALMVRYSEVAEECDTFVRHALDFLAEPTGMRKSTVVANQGRKEYKKRMEALSKAHCDWVGADFSSPAEHHSLSVKRGQAAYAALSFALSGFFTFPDHIKAPRAVIPKRGAHPTA